MKILREVPDILFVSFCSPREEGCTGRGYEDTPLEPLMGGDISFWVGLLLRLAIVYLTKEACCMPSKTGKALSLTKIPNKKSNKDAIANDTNDTNDTNKKLDKDTNRRSNKDANWQ